MMMNEEPVRVTIQQSSQMIEETLSTNMRRFKVGSSTKQRREVRKKRLSRDGDISLNNNLYNQGKLYNDDGSYFRHNNGLEKTSSQYPNHTQQQYQIPQQHQIHFQPIQQQQQQQHFQHHQQVPPTSPLHITPPISSSHPLSSFQTPNQHIQSSNGYPLMMCPSQIQMPMPIQMPIPMTLPHVTYDGSTPVQMPIHMPLQMPMQMPNMPLPMFIRLPVPPCASPASSNSSDDSLKSNISSGGEDGGGGVSTLSNGATVVNFIPLMFPPHLGPMLLGPSQPVMVTRLPPGSPNFHLMVNENQQRLANQQLSHQQQQQSQPTIK